MGYAATIGHGEIDAPLSPEGDEIVKVLDLFCGAGGAAMGLHRAWPDADIVGVDIEPQPRYPFTFIQGGWESVDPADFDFIWASPVCKRYTRMLNHGLTTRTNHTDFIPDVREVLISSGKSYVIENVVGSPLRNPGMLCGEMFGLRVMRHRLFECSFPVLWPNHIPHRGKGNRVMGDGGYYLRVYGHETGKREWGAAMGIDWMKSPELAQAIPPAFSEYIAKTVGCLSPAEGREMMKVIDELSPAMSEAISDIRKRSWKTRREKVRRSGGIAALIAIPG